MQYGTIFYCDVRVGRGWKDALGKGNRAGMTNPKQVQVLHSESYLKCSRIKQLIQGNDETDKNTKLLVLSHE